MEPTAIYTKAEVAVLLDVSARTLQRLTDLPWSDLGEHTPRMLGSELLDWMRRRIVKAA